MALLSDLVRIVAAVEGIDEVSVGIFARAAREAGHIAQGGRGRSAAKMTARDAANLLIAVNGCALAKEVPTRVGEYRDLKALDRNRTDIEIGRPGNLFGRDFEQLIELMADKGSSVHFAEMPSPAVIRFERPYTSVEFSFYTVDEDVTIMHHGYYRDSKRDETIHGDRLDLTIITARTLRAVAEAL